jgi:hypothetical protein
MEERVVNKKKTVACEYLIGNQRCQSADEEPEVKVVRADFCKNEAKDQCCYLCKLQNDCDIGCAYMEEPKPEPEVEVDDGPSILEYERSWTKDYFSLTKNFF